MSLFLLMSLIGCKDEARRVRRATILRLFFWPGWRAHGGMASYGLYELMRGQAIARRRANRAISSALIWGNPGTRQPSRWCAGSTRQGPFRSNQSRSMRPARSSGGRAAASSASAGQARAITGPSPGDLRFAEFARPGQCACLVVRIPDETAEVAWCKIAAR
jgi:hypothetical protein